MTVWELLKKCHSRELTEWMIYFQMENEKIKSNKEQSPEDLSLKLKAAFGGMGKKKKKSK